MAAYGSLVSVMNILDTIQLHPCPPISLDKIQAKSLTEKVTFLKEFLEGYSMESDYRKEADPFEIRITDAAYAAEDVIESHIVDQINPQSTGKKNIHFFNSLPECFQGARKAACCGFIACPTSPFYRRLQKVIEGFDLLKKVAMEIKEIRGVRDPLLRISEPASYLPSTYTGQSVAMVGFDDVLVEVMDKLTRGERDRQTIPIVGMGGTGKTTLALNVYQHQVVVQHFDFRAWVTISQEYRIRECLLELLQESRGNSDEQELGTKLHKKLSGRRYLIILDDIWDIEAWDQLRRYFPNNQNGSRIVITTRISNFEFIDSYVLKMGFLDKKKSWSLFSKVVFGEDSCPPELEEIGEKVVDNCRGLPLSIVVVGGLLAKSKLTREYWQYIAQNLNSTVNSEDDENCLRILHMSYKHLPIYLKPCFLYMGVFPEDEKISVSKLIKLWVSEGFVRPISGKSLEEVADKYLQELISRNMILADELGSIGSIKYCKIHDLLRDLSLRQAAKEMFYGAGTQRHIVVSENMARLEYLTSVQNMPLLRSVVCHFKDIRLFHECRLLRTLSCSTLHCLELPENEFKFVNSRCILFKFCFDDFTSSIHLFWNLQTLIVPTGFEGTRQLDIWNMPQLRHLKFASPFDLSDLPSTNHIVLANLQSLGFVRNFKCCAEMAKRIPNIKKLLVESEWYYHVNNFSHLHKLESLHYYQHSIQGIDYLQNLTFPPSLKKFTFHTNYFHWEDILETIGSLPLLEKLRLEGGRFRGGKWETIEGHFTRLKSLSVDSCKGLEYWTTESSHFPRLDRLVLSGLDELNDIPSEIGEIPTMRSVQLISCSRSAVISAKKIVEEQEEVYGEIGIQIQVSFSVYERETREALAWLASPNFQIL